MELAENMNQDCVGMLNDLLLQQEEQFFSQKMEGRILISNLFDMDQQVKQKAVNYFRAAKETEESVSQYEDAKYSVELKYHQKLDAIREDGS